MKLNKLYYIVFGVIILNSSVLYIIHLKPTRYDLMITLFTIISIFLSIFLIINYRKLMNLKMTLSKELNNYNDQSNKDTSNIKTNKPDLDKIEQDNRQLMSNMSIELEYFKYYSVSISSLLKLVQQCSKNHSIHILKHLKPDFSCEATELLSISSQYHDILNQQIEHIQQINFSISNKLEKMIKLISNQNIKIDSGNILENVYQEIYPTLTMNLEREWLDKAVSEYCKKENINLFVDNKIKRTSLKNNTQEIMGEKLSDSITLF